MKYNKQQEYIEGRLYCNIIRVRNLAYPKYMSTYPGLVIEIENWNKTLIIKDKPNPNKTDKRNLSANDDFFDKKIKLDLWKKRSDKYPVLFPLQSPMVKLPAEANRDVNRSHSPQRDKSKERNKSVNKRSDYKIKVAIYTKDVKDKALLCDNLRIAIDGEEVSEKLAN